MSGVDKQADKLTGGVDGVYSLVSCYNGKPLYRRQKSPAGEDRVMWWVHAINCVESRLPHGSVQQTDLLASASTTTAWRCWCVQVLEHLR